MNLYVVLENDMYIQILPAVYLIYLENKPHNITFYYFLSTTFHNFYLELQLSHQIKPATIIATYAATMSISWNSTLHVQNEMQKRFLSYCNLRPPPTPRAKPPILSKPHQWHQINEEFHLSDVRNTTFLTVPTRKTDIFTILSSYHQNLYNEPPPTGASFSPLITFTQFATNAIGEKLLLRLLVCHFWHMSVAHFCWLSDFVRRW